MQRTTVEELTTIRDLVLLTLCLEVIDYRCERASDRAEKERIERIQTTMINDIASLKKQLKAGDVKVQFEVKEDKGDYLEYPFICRGYQDKFLTHKDHFRAQIKVKIREYKG